jgi:NAD(P)-dependent dehydrogenase (short-subunit alcohol dehydrogenase family)
MNLTGKVAIVTGSKRVGGVTAVELARAGADLAIVYRSSRREADETASAIRALDRRVVELQADLQEVDACRRVVDEAAEVLGRLDVLVNMASVYVSRPFDELTLEDWNSAIDVDLRASWLCARAAVPHMRRQGEGHIVNVSDWVARSGRPRYPGFLPYYVAKAGVIGLTEALALELAPDRILVNAVAPGPILPPEGTSASMVAAVERATPLGRWGGEIEIARAVLAFVHSDFITGETLRVDGGRHVK